MFNKFLNRKEKAGNTEFSDFFHHAKAGERKKVFDRVIVAASRRQELILKETSTKACL